MTESHPVQRVEQTLRRVSQLRRLFLRLPRLPSPREQALIAAFRAFAAGHGDACSFEAMEAGLRDAHRRFDPAAILSAARRAGGWIREDPVLHPYYYWAQQAARLSRRGGSVRVARRIAGTPPGARRRAR